MDKAVIQRRNNIIDINNKKGLVPEVNPTVKLARTQIGCLHTEFPI